ncbi:MAG TPA: DUF6184 family natural product biosynthesis lipoprotein [Polyangiaceae bacterium]|nr:DUF6184 family natural product biosynthesis lipoprotein [Polyangiaceae bacterium]
MKYAIAAGLCASVFALLGCAGNGNDDSMTPASRRATETNERSIGALTATRCDKEARCGNVGPNGDYTSREDCVMRLERDARDDFDAEECPGGIDRAELDQCLKQIRSEDCGHVLDKLERVAECRSGALCLD